jgi:hypothetical protein
MSSISPLIGRLAASHWRENFSRRCGDARILTINLQSYKYINNLYIYFFFFKVKSNNCGLLLEIKFYF